VARRAERRAAAVIDSGPSIPAADAGILAFLNRLSTYLYVLARHCNRVQGVSETLWKA
jgi:cob(I)alamin adenosyltransferase